MRYLCGKQTRYGVMVMIVNHGMEQIQSIVMDLVKDAYERGRKDATDAIFKAATGQSANLNDRTQFDSIPSPDLTATSVAGRKRAPRGSVERVIRRALDANPGGVTIRQIMDMRETEGERMIADSSIRGELRRGIGARYKEVRDRWFYVNDDDDI
jgi:hypothetical protein